MSKSTGIVERLLAKAEKHDKDCSCCSGCWLWTGALSHKGYGHFRFNRTTAYAHRVAYELFVGPVPEGLEIDHLCSTRRCINPEHLEAVTHAENVRRGRLGAAMRERSHCKNGHEFTPENTRPRNDCAGRVCLTCSKEALNRWRARHADELRRINREAKRRERELLGVPERFPGRVHPRYQGSLEESA